MNIGAVTVLLISSTSVLTQAEELRQVTFDNCLPIKASMVQVKGDLYKSSVIELAKQLLFYVEAEESYTRKKNIISNWKIKNDVVTSTSYAQYLNVISAGSLQNFTIQYQVYKNKVCSSSTAYGSTEEFKRMIEKIRSVEESLPDPEIVQSFYELPEYYRVK